MGLSVVCAATACAGRSAAADDVHACIVASDEGQKLRDQRKLIAAGTQLALCARDPCPGPIQRACLQWRSEVESLVPTIVLAARDPAGRDLVHVRVIADGALLAESLDGGSIPMDPGPHELRFEAPDSTPTTMQVVLREGEKNRVVSAVVGPRVAPAQALVPLPNATPIPSSPGGSPVPLASWVLGAAGAVALGSFTTFGIIGQSDRSNLESCSKTETCPPGSVSAAETKLVAADVSLGIGIAALAAAVIVYVTHHEPGTKDGHSVSGPRTAGGTLPRLRWAF
ncbi:MAG TPA: hypothetical protein VIY73_05455 [Polyangiaceae bacterium]